MKHIIELREISKSYAATPILHGLDLSIEHGELITLLGPSGCGKTTLLRLIAGLDAPDAGQIILNGKDITNVPPQHRHVNMVFQNFALFPHMSVFDNVSFGLRCQHVDKNEIQRRVQSALELVKLDGFLQRKPTELSGGQQQRVAIARAIVNEPLVLLFDEPLASLDYRLRKNMQLELKQLQRKLGITFIFVTHDQEEALSMSDRVVVLHEGQIEQIGSPRAVYEEPCNLTVAKFIGELNIFDTTIVEAEETNIIVEIESLRLKLKNKRNFSAGAPVHVLMRPEDLRVYGRNEVTDTHNMISATIEDVTYKGSTVDLMVRLQSGRVLATTEFFDEDDAELIYSVGESVWVHWMQGWEVVLPYEN